MYIKSFWRWCLDIFTSLGILGTFVGLVWGLKNFEPSSYETMTNSVASLVEGIKVAFLTSIYGIALAIVYTSGMKSDLCGHERETPGISGKISCLCTCLQQKMNPEILW